MKQPLKKNIFKMTYSLLHHQDIYKEAWEGPYAL